MTNTSSFSAIKHGKPKLRRKRVKQQCKLSQQGELTNKVSKMSSKRSELDICNRNRYAQNLKLLVLLKLFFFFFYIFIKNNSIARLPCNTTYSSVFYQTFLKVNKGGFHWQENFKQKFQITISNSKVRRRKVFWAKFWTYRFQRNKINEILF